MSLAVTPLRPKCKARLIEMGFPKKQVRLAAQKFTTLRPAVDWLCAQMLCEQAISESIEPEMIGSSVLKKPASQGRVAQLVQVHEQAISESVQPGMIGSSVLKKPASQVRVTQSVQVEKSQKKPAHAVVQEPISGASMRAAAKVAQLKSGLQEMGFPADKIEAATEQYTTVRQAVEWLCSKEDDNIWVPVDQLNVEATNPVESSQHQQETANEVPSELQGAEADVEVELQGSETNAEVASSERKQRQSLDSEPMESHQRKRQSTDVEPVTPLSRFASMQIPSPSRARSNPMPPTALNSGTTTPVASPQLEPQNVAQPNDSEKVQTTLGDDLRQGVIDKRIIQRYRQVQSPGSGSRRTSLGSLLTVPAEAWSADQLQAALRQLHSFGSQRYESPVRTLTRKRLKCKQSVPSYPSTSPILGTNGAQESKRRRLRFKQTSPEYPAVTPNAATDQSLPTPVRSPAGSSRGRKLPKAFAKWSALLLDMGFPADQVDSNLRKYKSLQKAIDALC